MPQNPILLLIFNRLETTKQVMQALRQVKPGRLYIAADGPRPSKEGEFELCESTRNYVVNAIDWDCNVITNFQESNLGCGKHVSGAITWFFSQEEQGIILEDDCIPHIDFFSYCDELLEKYKHNTSIFTIGGNNFQNKPVGNASYYFSAFGHIWGWATWRRSWEKYQFNSNEYDAVRMRERMKHYFRHPQAFDFWWRVYEQMCTDPVDTWDFQWSFCQWYNNGINIIPNVNLVKNIGYGEDATHTKEFVEGILDRSAEALPKIIHPSKVAMQRAADMQSFYTNFEKKKKGYLLRKIKEKVRFELKKRIKR